MKRTLMARGTRWCLASMFLAACWLGMAMPARSQESKVIKIQVPANKAWTATGIRVSGGYVAIHAVGTIEAAPEADRRPFFHNVPPDGREARFGQMPQPGLPAMCLMGKIGDNGRVFYVGNYIHQLGTGDEGLGSGELFLGINDDNVNDNSGAWNVAVYLPSPPQPVTTKPVDGVKPVDRTGQILWTERDVYGPADTITVGFNKDRWPNSGYNYISLAKVGVPDTEYLAYDYLDRNKDGKVNFKALPEGEYEARAHFGKENTVDDVVKFRYRFRVGKLSDTIGAFNKGKKNEEIDKALKKAGAKSGEVQVSLFWRNKNDLDLSVVTPDNETIGWHKPKAKSGGTLDVDANAASATRTDQAIENIYWPPGKAAKGTYTVHVNFFRRWDDCPDATPFTLRIVTATETREFQGEVVASDAKKRKATYAFEVK